VVFELWDTETANMVGSYATEAEALGVVRRAIEAYGAGYADGLALVLDDEVNDVQTLAIGAELAARAKGADAVTVGRSRP
jgi:hypothetical protein